MKLGIFLCLISFFLEGFLSRYLTAPFLPMFSLLLFVLSYPYFGKEKQTYLLTWMIFGIWYDMLYTGWIGYHSILFLCLGMVTISFYRFFSYRSSTTFCLYFSYLCFYHIITYGIRCVFLHQSFSSSVLLKGIGSTILCNFLFYLLFQLLSKQLEKRFRISIPRF